MRDIAEAIFGSLLVIFGGWAIGLAAQKLHEDLLALPIVLIGMIFVIAGICLVRDGVGRDTPKKE